LFASESGIFDKVLVFGDMEAGESAGHGEIVATEGGGVGDAAIETGKDTLVDRATHDDRGAGNVTAREGFRHGDDVGVEIPVLEAEPFTGSA